jgi:hypothetical protein
MTSNNYCLIKKNKIYEDIYDILEDKELVMDNPNHKDDIKYQIKNLAKTYYTKKMITISNIFENSEATLEDLMLNITGETENDINETENESLQGNTLLMYANSKFMYEVVFMEQLGINKTDDELNQLSSISNIELAPIYGQTAVIKTSYVDGSIKPSIILEEDITDLIINNFYHVGVLINPDGSMLELEFAGDNPNIMIGGNFKMLSPLSLFGLQLVCYHEDGDKDNDLASKIYGKEIKGRLYIATLCPITNKRFWSITSEFLQDLIKLLDYTTGTPEQRKKIDELENELNDDKLKNPFFLVKKYCV